MQGFRCAGYSAMLSDTPFILVYGNLYRTLSAARRANPAAKRFAEIYRYYKDDVYCNVLP